MTDVVHIIGARPNLPKFKPVWEHLEKKRVDQVWIHTGQHHDISMFQESAEFFELQAPDIAHNLNGLRATEFLSLAISALSKDLEKLNPRLVIVYGDVNSTVAAALASAYVGFPLMHVESGLRCNNRFLPEERNRKIVDAVSDYLVTSMPSAYQNLITEGVEPNRIFQCGNTMIDTLASYRQNPRNKVFREFKIKEREFGVVTLHRNTNVDDRETLNNTLNAVIELSKQIPIIFPLHPRTAKNIGDFSGIRFIRPLAYPDFIDLISSAKLVLTDSGGIQEETTYLKIPCFTFRESTERPETITQGTNKLVTLSEIPNLLNLISRTQEPSAIYGWDGQAGQRISDLVSQLLTEMRAN